MILGYTINAVRDIGITKIQCDTVHEVESYIELLKKAWWNATAICIISYDERHKINPVSRIQKSGTFCGKKIEFDGTWKKVY